jgi:lipid II isoglutaminyl synthase (glutamine-hydrolysing)
MTGNVTEPDQYEARSGGGCVPVSAREPSPPRRRAEHARLSAGVAAGRLAGLASRALGRGEGWVIGGKACLAIAPDAARLLAAGRRIALVSGTNGKTTTTAMLAAALATRGEVATNRTGANVADGIVAALLEQRDATLAAIEVDERFIPWAFEMLAPEAVAFLNLSRDQLSRLNETRMIAQRWRECVTAHPEIAVIANADDPLVVWAAQPAEIVQWVAVGQPWTEDAIACPACQSVVEFAETGWACTSCDFARPEPDVRLVDDRLLINDGTELEVDPALPGERNRANVAMAAITAGRFGVEAKVSVDAAVEVEGVSGRYRTVQVGSSQVRLLLAKNPASWQETLRFIPPPPAPVVLVLNARDPDGHDPSWIWDVPFEELGDRPVICTGDRASDLSVRLAYAGIEHDWRPDVDEVLDRLPWPEVDVIANYSAFQDLRRRLGRVS